MSYIRRSLEKIVLQVTKEYPVVLLSGPRQVGKTTMLKKLMEGTERSYVSLDDLQEGIMVGLLLGLSLMVLRYNLALKREEAFNRLYIQVTDERNRMIDEKTRTLLFDILLLLAAGLSLLSMIFPIILNLNQFLTLTIILVLGLYYLLRFLLSKRY